MDLLFFPNVTDYSKEIRDLSPHFMDLFKNHIVPIITRLDFVKGKDFYTVIRFCSELDLK